jgi:hypothetical protein
MILARRFRSGRRAFFVGPGEADEVRRVGKGRAAGFRARGTDLREGVVSVSNIREMEELICGHGRKRRARLGWPPEILRNLNGIGLVHRTETLLI